MSQDWRVSLIPQTSDAQTNKLRCENQFPLYTKRKGGKRRGSKEGREWWARPPDPLKWVTAATAGWQRRRVHTKCHRVMFSIPAQKALSISSKLTLQPMWAVKCDWSRILHHSLHIYKFRPDSINKIRGMQMQHPLLWHFGIATFHAVGRRCTGWGKCRYVQNW